MLAYLRFILRVLFPLSLCVIVASFAASNPGRVSLRLSPLPYAVDLPIYLLALGLALAGFLMGRMSVAFRHRRHHRHLRRELKASLARTKALEEQAGALDTERRMQGGALLPLPR